MLIHFILIQSCLFTRLQLQNKRQATNLREEYYGKYNLTKFFQQMSRLFRYLKGLFVFDQFSPKQGFKQDLRDESNKPPLEVFYKRLLLEIFLSSQENTCVRVSFLALQLY